MARWDKLSALRDDVNGVLEAARGAKASASHLRLPSPCA